MLSKFCTTFALLGAVSLAPSGAALADEHDRDAGAVKLLATIPVPGVKMKSFDISWVDADTQLYYLADRSNAAVNVVDAKRNVFVKQIHGGFKGFTGNNDTSGPNGVVVAGHFLFVTDAPSRVVTIDLRTDQIVGEAHTGGAPGLRTDELAYDPENSLIFAVNNADEPPFATLIKVDRNTGALTVKQRVTFADATNGAEQPQWVPGTGRFYISIPQVGPNPQDGAVKKINPQNGAVEATFPVKFCQPAGLTLGPNQDLLVGCSVAFDTAGNQWKRDPAAVQPSAKPISVIMDARNGSIDKVIEGIGGNDEVWYNSGDNRYYLAARNQPGGSSTPGADRYSPVLGIIDAKKMTLDQVIPTVSQAPGSAHSVAVNPHNNHALVPYPANNVAPNCLNGCIAVFGSANEQDD
jgi:hypothetical protein